ncbi:hypothetical protein JTB14_035824 [Gonioctena quinquepunctata]|nr:hypothetical protein JTB14_035824 [Gonioctena quinquepunctata]
MEIVSEEQKKLPNGNESFCKFFRTKINFEDQTKIKEQTMDLFEVSLDYALAHCVSADMETSRGIAVTFKKKIGRIEKLVKRNQDSGGLAVPQSTAIGWLREWTDIPVDNVIVLHATSKEEEVTIEDHQIKHITDETFKKSLSNLLEEYKDVFSK